MPVTKTTGFLSGNVLKLLAAAFMLIDHVGVIFFPQNVTFRLIGRLAMPIFAFMVAEGCRYTHSKLRYLLILAGYLVLCQAGLYIGTGGTNLCILAAFALGAAAGFCLQEFKQALFSSDMPHKLLWGGLFLLAHRRKRQNGPCVTGGKGALSDCFQTLGTQIQQTQHVGYHGAGFANSCGSFLLGQAVLVHQGLIAQGFFHGI